MKKSLLIILILLIIPITVNAGIICSDGWESSCVVPGPGCCSHHGGIGFDDYSSSYNDEPNYGAIIVIGIIVVVIICIYKSSHSINSLTKKHFRELENSSGYENFIEHHTFLKLPKNYKKFEIMNYNRTVDDYAIWDDSDRYIYIVPLEKNVFSYNFYLRGLFEYKMLSTINTITLVVKDLDDFSKYIDNNRIIPKFKLKNKHINFYEKCELHISSYNKKVNTIITTDQEGLRILNNYFKIRVITEEENLEEIRKSLRR